MGPSPARPPPSTPAACTAASWSCRRRAQRSPRRPDPDPARGHAQDLSRGHDQTWLGTLIRLDDAPPYVYGSPLRSSLCHAVDSLYSNTPQHAFHLSACVHSLARSLDASLCHLSLSCNTRKCAPSATWAAQHPPRPCLVLESRRHLCLERSRHRTWSHFPPLMLQIDRRLCRPRKKATRPQVQMMEPSASQTSWASSDLRF